MPLTLGARLTLGDRCVHALMLLAAVLLVSRALAHPGSGIVVDRAGMIYMVDMVNGVWKVDAKGAMTHMPGQAFHWMTLDAGDRFAKSRLLSGPAGEIERLGAGPTLLTASDGPIAVGPSGDLFFDSHAGTGPVRILRLTPAGEQSVVATLPAEGAHGPLRYLNGLAAGADGSLYYTEDDAIRKVSAEGRVSTVAERVTVAGCAEGPLLRGLDVGADGAVYVAATGCKNVLKMTPAGAITVMPQLARDVWSPTGVAVSGGDLYVLEFERSDGEDRRSMLPRLRKIAADGTTTIVAAVTKR